MWGVCEMKCVSGRGDTVQQVSGQWYLDVPGGARGRVGAAQGPRDAPRAPHADCRAPPAARAAAAAHACSLSAPDHLRPNSVNKNYDA